MSLPRDVRPSPADWRRGGAAPGPLGFDARLLRPGALSPAHPTRIGQHLFAFASAAMCLAAFILADTASAGPPWLVRSVAGGLLVVMGLATTRRTGRLLMLAVGLFWAAALAADLAVLAGSTPSLLASVHPAESATLMLGAYAAARTPSAPGSRLQDAALPVLMVLFGVVHVVHADAVATLVPVWLPGRAGVPCLTGSILLAAGACMFARQTRAAASAIIGAMFASWLVLVHGPRLWHAPADFGEWRFALTALALVGTIVASAGGRDTRRPQCEEQNS